MCPNDASYTAAKVIGTLLSVVNRILKSFAFNVLVFTIGFTVGYIFIASKVHYYATQHDDIAYLQRISDKIDEMAEMDLEYTKKQEEAKQIVMELKAKLSHDVHHECGNPIGDTLFIHSQH